MGIMMKCLLSLDASVCLSEHNLGALASAWQLLVLRGNARADKIVGTPSLISALYQEPGKIQVYILLKWGDVVFFFPLGFAHLHT